MAVKKKVGAKKVAPKEQAVKAERTAGTGAVKKSAPRTATGQKTSKRAQAAKSGTGTVTPEERWQMIAVAAYYHAEKRGFVGGNPAEDWAAAEAEIDAQLAEYDLTLRE